MNYPVVSVTKGPPESSSNPVHAVIPSNIRRISLNPAHPVILSNTRVEQLIAWANPPSTAACVVLSSPDVARGFDWKHRFRQKLRGPGVCRARGPHYRCGT